MNMTRAIGKITKQEFAYTIKLTFIVLKFSMDLLLYSRPSKPETESKPRSRQGEIHNTLRIKCGTCKPLSLLKLIHIPIKIPTENK